MKEEQENLYGTPDLAKFRTEKRLSRQEEGPSDIDRHYEWIRAHMWQYLSWVRQNYGSLESFEKEVSVRADKVEKDATDQAA